MNEIDHKKRMNKGDPRAFRILIDKVQMNISDAIIKAKKVLIICIDCIIWRNTFEALPLFLKLKLMK